MFLALAIFASSGPLIGPPVQWANGIAAPPRIPLVGDVDHDGYCDLVALNPVGEGTIDVALNMDGAKSGRPFTSLRGWGKDCQCAVTGEFDTQPGADIVGLFDGSTLRLAGAFSDGKFKDEGVYAKLPGQLKDPSVSVIFGRMIVAYSTSTGRGWILNDKGVVAQTLELPRGTVWIGQSGGRVVGQNSRGQVFLFARERWAVESVIGAESRNSRPTLAGNAVIFGSTVWDAGRTYKLAQSGLPEADSIRLSGDFDRDGDDDVFEFRYGSEMHSGYQVMLRIQVRGGETDSDNDGLTNDEERDLGTDPANPDTDGDGLLDGWEVKGFRGLDMKSLGCDPRHIDLICLVSRFESVNEERCKSQISRAATFYSQLKSPNPDGTTGFRLHPVYLDPVSGEDTKKSWQANREKFLPAKWRGVVHWMQVTPGGGGQADQLGDGGTIGENALWAVFVHEFGHQMGMDHEGFWNNGLCPIYTSLMNYAYSYSLEDDANKIHYSDGQLDGYVLKETDLDETIPLPYDKVKFLEKGPYRFRLQPHGDTTLIDWNWNGIFGEKHVRADINYSYSTNAGRRDDVGKTQTAPWLFTYKKSAYLLYGTHDFPVDRATDPSVGPSKPGKVVLRKLVKPFEWQEPLVIVPSGLTGDPVGAAQGDKICIVYQSSQGVMISWIDPKKDQKVSQPSVLDTNGSLVPSVGTVHGRLFVFLTDPESGVVTYRVINHDKVSKAETLDATSTNPVGICEDTVTGEAIIALAQDQDAKQTHRWQVRRYRESDGRFEPVGSDWVGGEKGSVRGVGRLTVLFDKSRDAGPHGRVYIYGKGMTNSSTPWSCTYVAHQVEDKSVGGGWMLKRFYDEWTQSRSAPAAAWYQGDVIWAYRWVDGGQGSSDNVLHVGYKALGIQSQPMGDHDDLTFFRTWGIRNSLLYLARE